MHIFNGHHELLAHRAPTAVAIGIFDGVHRGHQQLLHEALAHARSDRLRSLVYTFNPHPARILNPDLAPQLIEPLAARLTRLEALGFDAVLVEPFSRAFAATGADTFVRTVLVDAIEARHVVVGAGFTFGSRQRGNVALLQELGSSCHFTVHPVQHVHIQGVEVSSTKVREFVREGLMPGAALLLGRPYAIMGVVHVGAQRGTGLGFPTANVKADNELLPGVGVYAGYAQGVFGRRATVVNVGVAPTFGGHAQLKVEAHLLDYDGGPLYNTHLTVELTERLRDEQRFSGVEALKAQLTADVARARTLLTPMPAGS